MASWFRDSFPLWKQERLLCGHKIVFSDAHYFLFNNEQCSKRIGFRKCDLCTYHYCARFIINRFICNGVTRKTAADSIKGRITEMNVRFSGIIEVIFTGVTRIREIFQSFCRILKESRLKDGFFQILLFADFKKANAAKL